jgi:predicted ribosome quality control (RQC) complex YloA/Tae2 family protein
MRGIAALEVSAVVSELKEKIDGSFFKSFYELSDNAFLLVLTKERKPFSIYINLAKAMNETEFKEKAEEPTQFTTSVRKKLDGARVKGIAQHGSDRIVTIDFTGKEDRKMVIEMFDKGNLLFVNKDGLADLAYSNRSFKDRNARRGMIYAFPESESVPYDKADKEKLSEIIENETDSDQKLISAISKHLNVGPMYLEEAISKAGLKSGTAAKDQKIDVEKLSREIRSILDSAKKPEPVAYKKGEAYADFAIYPISKYAEMEKESFKTVSQLFDALYIKERTTSIDSGKLREIEELKMSVETQRAQIENMRKKGDEYKEVANKIYERMHEINELLAALKKKNPKSLDDAGRKFGNINLKGIDAKRKTVRIDME